MTVFEHSYHQGNKNRRAYYTNDYTSESTLETTSSYYGVVPISSGVDYFTIGFINVNTRTIDQAYRFQMAMVQVSAWEMFKLVGLKPALLVLGLVISYCGYLFYKETRRRRLTQDLFSFQARRSGGQDL